MMQRSFSGNLRLLTKDILLVFTIWILLNYQFVFPVYAQQSASTPHEKFTCDVEQLSAEDSFKILDLLAKGFTGSEFRSALQQDTNKSRERLENSTIIIPIDRERNEATKIELANEKFHLKEALHIANDWIRGPYSFGIVLTDTLRVGRCVDLEDKNIPCPLSGKQLMLRNSATGIKGDFKPLWETFKSMIPGLKDKDPEELSDAEYRRIRELLGLPESAEEDLKLRFAFSDVNDMNLQTYKRIPGKIIPNSILTHTFLAYGQTTCNSADCIISVYSLFDKYYNNWFSMDLVFSTVGPTLFARAKTLFSHIGLTKTFPFRITQTEMAERIRMRLFGPQSYFGKKLRARLKWRATRYPEIGKLRAEISKGQWTSGYDLLTNPGLQQKIVGDWLSSGGWLTKIDDPVIRRELFRYAKDLEKFTKTNAAFVKQARKIYQQKVSKYGFGSAQEIAARIDYGKTVSKALLDYTDSIPLDAPGWFARNAASGLYTLNVKQLGATSPSWLAGDSTYIYDMLNHFSKEGHFAGLPYETAGRSIKTWRLKGFGRQVGEVTFDDLERGFYKYKGYYIKLDSGSFMPVDDWSMPLLKKQMTGPKPIFTEGKTLAGEISPEDFASKLMEARNILNLTLFAPDNAEYLRHALAARGFALRRYSSLLDRALSYQEQFFHNYFRPKGGAKWTALFNLYWLGKRGFNQKFASAYMLPDTWREVRWPLGSSELYNDAFIDFFSHEGSDQGDMFNRMLQVMPWEWVARNVFANFKPLRELYEKLKGGEIRNKVENLAFYATTPQDCLHCGVALRSGMDYSYFLSSFYASRKLDAYILEDVVSEEAKKKGTTIITYTHHTDLEGKEKDVSGSTRISLEEAIKKKETCRDAVEKVTIGAFPSFAKPHMIGGALAFTENLGYMIFGFGGVFGSIVQQLVLAPKLQDCVDVDGGYYTHIFLPTKEDRSDSKAPSQISAETALKGLQSFTDSLTSMFKSNTNSYTSQAAEALDKQVKDFVGGAKQDDIVQANVHMEGPTFGTLEGEQLFSFWFKGETSPTKYKTAGQKIIASDGNLALLVDFANGRILLVDLNGDIIDVITDNNVPARMISTNTNIPADEVPKRYTLIGLPDSNEPLFEMTLDSELIVLVPDVAECILEGIEYQTGLEYANANINRLNLTNVFGKVLAITTDTHVVRAAPEEQRIIAEGVPRIMLHGADVKAVVLTNRTTLLKKDDTNKEVGLFESVQFENGVILYKPDTHELIVWLKRNKQADLSQEYVGGLNLGADKVIDPETFCPVPAVSLAAIPTEPEGIAAYKVEQFNKAMQHVGPFTVLETPTRRFVFFARYEPDGKCAGLECCRNYIRIINKETGEVYEAPIDSFQVTPEGIHIKDAKGNEHNIGLTAEDGRPMVVYNNYPPEPLVSAQGPNGSFWYDPEKGMWHAENAQLLPLLEAFRNGALTQVGPTGQIITRPGDNIMNIQAGLGAGPFNLPSLPTEPFMLVVYMCSLVLTITWLRCVLVKRKKKTKKRH
jgi:hypothetical protein